MIAESSDSNKKVGDTVYWVGAGNEISDSGKIIDFPTDGKMTIKWDSDGKVEEYDINQPDIESENEYTESDDTENKSIKLQDRETEVKEFFDKIPFEELYNKIREVLGDNSIKFNDARFKGYYYDRFLVEIESENLADKCGIMSPVYKEVLVDDFGAGIIEIKEKENSGNLRLYVPVDFSFKYKSGGTNGIEILRAEYDEKDGWIFNTSSIENN